jgi:hypothetical protein
MDITADITEIIQLVQFIALDVQWAEPEAFQNDLTLLFVAVCRVILANQLRATF